MTAIFLIGAVVTANAYPVLFGRRYPGQPRWIVIGVVVGLAAMLLWPVTLWVALAMWLTGFTRRGSTGRRRRRVVLPLAVVGSLATFLVMGAIIGPRPASPLAGPVAVADIVAPTATAAPTTAAVPPTTATSPTSSASVATTTMAPTTTTRPPVATTTPSPEPQPNPAPHLAPKPKPDPKPDPDADTRRHTGNTGHPCLPGERDGDNDGYCGEGR
jgi:hypothetical protein